MLSLGNAAQLLVIPHEKIGKRETKRTGGFGSTNKQGKAAYWINQITDTHHTCEIAIQVKKFKGLTDTGAVVSIISLQHWPLSWTVEMYRSKCLEWGRPLKYIKAVVF